MVFFSAMRTSMVIIQCNIVSTQECIYCNTYIHTYENIRNMHELNTKQRFSEAPQAGASDAHVEVLE